MDPLSSMPPMTAATYIALLASIVALWIGRKFWIGALIVAVALGYASGVLLGLAALWIALFGGLCFAFVRAKSLAARWKQRLLTGLSALCMLVLALLLGMHALPGFRNFLALDDVVLSPGAEPFTLYLNFDKTVVGIFILGICYAGLLRSSTEWGNALRRALPLVAISTLLLALFAIALGYLFWQPKWTSLFWIWAASNLFLTCLSEEALFRGFIQRELTLALQGRSGGHWIAIVVSGALFGVAHFGGGPSYVALATAAGIGYGYIYHRTRSIEMAMLAHFALNATHFLLFTYPRAA
jgi:membrane protease YdiL (CAAX protease family)